MKIVNQSSLTSKITLPDSTEREITTLSNQSETELITESFLKIKSSAKDFAEPSEDLEQTIILTNNSDFDIENVSIKDNLSVGATFKAGSLQIDNVEYPDYDATKGFDLPNSIPSQTSTAIKYMITIDASPRADTVTNSAEIVYTINGQSPITESTNLVTIPLVNNRLNIIKSANKLITYSGDTIKYTIEIKNVGTIDNKNLIFKDQLPNELSFIPNSVKINNVEKLNANPNTGFALDDLPKNTTTTITFEATVH